MTYIGKLLLTWQKGEVSYRIKILVLLLLQTFEIINIPSKQIPKNICPFIILTDINIEYSPMICIHDSTTH